MQQIVQAYITEREVISIGRVIRKETNNAVLTRNKNRFWLDNKAKAIDGESIHTDVSKLMRRDLRFVSIVLSRFKV